MDAKDLLIEQLMAENKALKETIKILEEKIARLEKNSNNSSEPPSSDIVKPKKPTRKSKGTEREIRHTVIDRRITQRARGQAGMHWCERIWTAIATCKKQNRNVFEFIHHNRRLDRHPDQQSSAKSGSR